MMEPVILIADDHSIIRKGLKLYMQLNLNYTNITEVATCNDLMNKLVKKTFTHLVLDLILSDGNTLEIIPNIKKLYPTLNIMVFSMQPNEIYGEALKQYGIYNYMFKSVGEEEIIANLKKFLQNEALIETKAVEGYMGNPFSNLAPRELEVLHYILKGIGTKDISETLNLKMNTISTIKNRIFEKTNAINSKELMELATLYNVNY
jgi:two-component system, NarL family, invasion response regulator UvrY